MKASDVLKKYSPDSVIMDTKDSTKPLGIVRDAPVETENVLKAMCEFAEMVRDEQIKMDAVWSTSVMKNDRGCCLSVAERFYDHVEEPIKVKITR
jgi:hypothetical protein